jgi:hypothetical protein
MFRYFRNISQFLKIQSNNKTLTVFLTDTAFLQLVLLGFPPLTKTAVIYCQWELQSLIVKRL